MRPQRRVFLVGGAHTKYIGKGHPDFIWKRHPDFGTRENPSIEQHMKAAIDAALETTGVSAAAIERGFVGNFAGQTFASQGHLGAMAPRAHKDLAGKPWTRLEAACASGGISITSAAEALQAGYDTALVVGAEVQTTVSAREGGDFLARAAHYALERGIDDFTFPAMFARRWKVYQETYGATEADMGHLAVKAYGNANKNPLAHMHTKKVTLEWASASGDSNPRFLRNEELRDYMKVSDCSQVSDGGSACVLATEEGLAK
ncbi:MAG: acetyl-CoA acyltransferase, partial [Myxococcota bacterium]